MLLAHAVTLTEARSYLAALADQALTFDATVEYERILLHLDVLHGDYTPAISPVPSCCRGVLFSVAHAAIAELDQHGVDMLSVELLLDMLDTARSKDLS